MQQAKIALPAFSAIKIDEIEAGLDALIDKAKARIDELTALPQKTWQNFALPIQEVDVRIGDFWSPVSHLNGVMNSDELREVYQACIAKLTAYSSEFGQNAELFNAYKALAEGDAFAGFSQAQKSWVEHALRDFRLSGVDLPKEKQERYKSIKARLAELSQQYSNNVLDATAAWQKNISDSNALQGLPESSLAMLKQMAEQKGRQGYLLTLDFPVYQAVITYADDRSLRREMYLAYMTKASDQGPNTGEFDNSEIMVEILALKQELAELLGYANYAELSLVPKMANDVAEVLLFLEDLAEKSRAYAEREIEVMQRYAKETLGIELLQAWDFGYVSEKYRQQHYALSDEQLREYFPLETVLQGLFTIVERLFGIRIQQQMAFDSYHADARLYHIYKDGAQLASFYFDLFARDKKRGGAWMADCHGRWLNPQGEQELPVAFLTCNFRPATGDKPALLSHTEVTTLFHEFGHGIHHMLTQQNIVGIAGISGVEWDAVELPSQFLENWCWQPESLKLISSHYASGEPLPESLLESMLAAKNFNAGIMMMRQLEFALFDMRLHSKTGVASAAEIQAVLDHVREEVSVLLPPAQVRFQHAFSHIFAGGYAAGYYSYKWAEVLSADAFSRFEEEGLFDETAGRAFLQEVLEMGSARPAGESFKAFRGREPDIDALLRHSGLV